MPIYEYYCPNNHTIYQFYAKTLAQGSTVPRCPDNPAYTMRKLVSAFAITRPGGAEEPAAPEVPAAPGGDDDPRMDAAMQVMEKEFAHVDENDPKAMARMVRRMSDLTGEKIEGELEAMVRKLEEGADPDALEAEFGTNPPEDFEGDDGATGEDLSAYEKKEPDPKEPRHRFRHRRSAPRRDPKLYDYE